jgi:site-specific recombinase XerD
MQNWRKEAPAPLVRVTPLDRIAALAVDAVPAARTKEIYRSNLQSFLEWFRAQSEPLNRQTVMAWRAWQQTTKVCNKTINQRLSSVRKLVKEAANNGYLDEATAAGILRIENLPTTGGRNGNWLTAEQLNTLLDSLKAGDTLADKRDRALFALLIGGWLRRNEACHVRITQLQERDGRPVIVDHQRKWGRTQTIPLPTWAAAWVREWIEASGITEGYVLRNVTRWGTTGVDWLSPAGVWEIVHRRAAALGYEISPHDLRRTCAKIARHRDVPLEKIQTQLGHANIETTMLYVGSVEGMADAACDHVLPTE